MFWGDERIKTSLPMVLGDSHESLVECASCRLRVGAEVYVSPTGEPHDPHNKTKTRLKDEDCFTIPPGQFGFILTEERVCVPEKTIAFISIRSKYTFRGLVNVSGFHVDPGYNGHLMFSVFNAGPTAVHLRRGEECFLIWFADLETPSPRQQGKSAITEIPSGLIGYLSQGVLSLPQLKARIDKVEREHIVIRVLVGIIVGLVISWVTFVVRSNSVGGA